MNAVDCPATDELPEPVLISAGPFRLKRLAEAYSPAWYAYRRRGIGASEAGAVVAKSRFGSPIRKFLQKTGKEDEPSDRLLLQIAKAAEGPLADRLAKEAGFSVASLSPGLFAHPDYPWMMASPDLLTDDPRKIGGELKLFGRLDAEAPEELPIEVQLQCQQNMAVTGASAWWVGVGVFNWSDYKFNAYLLPRNDELIGSLIEAEAEFWDHVVAGVPPEQYEGMNLDDVKLLFPSVRPQFAIELSEGSRAAWAEIEKLRMQIDSFVKPLEKRIDALKAAVAYEMGEAEIGDLGNGKCVKRISVAESVSIRKAHVQLRGGKLK